jgi:hypothetical protein
VSFEHPLALLLLVVPAILLWLRTRAERPRPAEASSLLVWQKVSPSDTVPEKPRPPLAAWIEAAGAALLAVGMAGPMGAEGAPAPVAILNDLSPSVGVDARRTMLGPFPAEEAKVEEWPSTDPERDLPALLAAGKPVIVVTDHHMPEFPDEPHRLRVIGRGKRAFNAGITAASGVVLPDGRWRVLLVVESHGSSGPVQGTLRIGSVEDPITLGPGKALELEREVSRDTAWARILFPGDCMEADDAVMLRGAGGEAVVFSAPDRADLGPMVRALEAAGARRDGLRSLPDSLTLKGEKGGALQLDFFAPDAGTEAQPILGRNVTTPDHPLTRDVHIDPGVTMGSRSKPAVIEKEVAPDPVERLMVHPPSARLLDEEGQPLATYYPEERNDAARVMFRFIPGGTWAERDPSFVVLAKNMVEFVGGGEPRVEAEGLLNARETREAAEGETFGDLRSAIEEMRRPDPASRASYAFVLLMLGGGGLAAAWLAMR